MPAFIHESDPLVSIVVLNWNGALILPRCLNAIAAQTFQDFEVIVADNASTDGSAEEIEKRWPGFKVIRFDQNLGFALGNNRAASEAKGRWLAFVNNDAFPDPDWLGCIMKAAQTNPGFSFFSSRLVYADQPDRVQSSGDIYNISGFAWSRDNHCPVEQAHLDPDEVFSPSAAAAVYLSDAFIEAGGFTRRFTSHHEDVDLGFRLRLLGYRCLLCPRRCCPSPGVSQLRERKQPDCLSSSAKCGLGVFCQYARRSFLEVSTRSSACQLCLYNLLYAPPASWPGLESQMGRPSHPARDAS